MLVRNSEEGASQPTVKNRFKKWRMELKLKLGEGGATDQAPNKR